jgi:hypothetical protein
MYQLKRRSPDAIAQGHDEVARAGGRRRLAGLPGGRTEVVLVAALRAAAPAVRAVRSADRANMVI